MNKTIATALLATVFAALMIQPDAMAQQQKIYKWVDAEGVVHYTARPPEGVDYQEVGVEVNESEASEPEEAEEGGGEDEASDIPPEQPQMERSEPDPELIAERCEQARSNMENLNRYQNVTVEGEDGEQRQISDEERMRMLEQAQEFIDEWC